MPFSSVSLLSLDPAAYLLPTAGPRTPPPPRLRRVVLRAASVSAVAEESSAAAAARGRLESLSQVAGVLGTQWGDEGKGKLVDILAQRFDVVARCQVSAALLGRVVFDELLPPSRMIVYKIWLVIPSTHRIDS
jgi:adenylosuccinate synthase